MPADLFWIIFGPILGVVVIWLIFFAIRKAKESNVRETIRGLAANEIELTPEEFFKMRNYKGRREKGVGKYALNYNFEGVYIIYNETKNMYYVGQGRQVLNRVNNHFTGKGNGDVYADYKYGDSFKIKMISLENSGYDDLNKLEYDTIKTYNAFAKGYNKTSGNKTPSRNLSSIIKDYEYDDSDEEEINAFDEEMMRKSKEWQENKAKFAAEYKKGIAKIKKYALDNNDWYHSTKSQRINYFYLNEKFYYKKPATWPEFIDHNLEFTMSPLPKTTIESIIEPIYKKTKINNT